MTSRNELPSTSVPAPVPRQRTRRSRSTTVTTSVDCSITARRRDSVRSKPPEGPHEQVHHHGCEREAGRLADLVGDDQVVVGERGAPHEGQHDREAQRGAHATPP